MKKFKAFFLFMFSSILMAALGISIFAASTMATTVNVELEQQESVDGTQIRFISTISPVTDLSTITKIDIELSLSKDGEATKYASVPTTKIYTSVSGTNGKTAKANTYYAVYTVTDVNAFEGWSLSTDFKYYFSDSSTKTTNTVVYDIVSDYTITSLGSGTFEASSSISECFNVASSQEGTIFHAWCWSMETIENNLENIKAAGFTTVQTSPMQPQKDYYPTDTMKSGWWKAYQPLGFSIATTNNALGTKAQLESMATKAHSLGMKVIVDVVANHLAGSTTTLYSDVKNYEPEIYGSNGTYSGGALIHEGTSSSATDSSAYSVTHGNIGMPDLDTGNSTVQTRVLSLLKEYIDVGVDGFRFDAAKHIETPSDSDGVKSSFWSTVLNGATSYATSKGKDAPYYYGEILNTCGTGRSYSFYTALGMSVTDNTTGNNIRSAVDSNNAASAAASTYNTGLAASKVVLWGESHDTYANEPAYESTAVSQKDVNKAYALVASRNAAASLYFGRPTASDGVSAWTGTSTLMGNVSNVSYKNAEIAAVNKFHNYFNGSSEYLYNSGTYAMNVRYNATNAGMVLVNVADSVSSSVSVSCPKELPAGTYKDLVSDNTFTVTAGSETNTVTGTMSSSGIAVLYNPNITSNTISISCSDSATFYTDTTTATFKIANASAASMSINDGTEIIITSGATIEFGSHMEIGDTLKVKIYALNEDLDEETVTFTFTKVAPPREYTVYFKNNQSWSTVNAHMWHSTSGAATTWPGEEMSYDDALGLYYVTYTEGTYDHVIFNNGTTQTVNLELDPDNYDTFTPSTTTTDASDGKTKWKCNTSLTDACDHSYTSEITKQPTCTAAGVKTYTCTKCSKSYTKPVAATGHTLVDGICSVCGYDSTAHTHTWVYTSTITKQTRTTTGLIKETCSDCSETRETATPALGTVGVYFTNNYAWTTVYAYVYNSSSNKYSAWPGTLMEKVGTNDAKQDIYYIGIDVTEWTYIIFNNGVDKGPQTVNITIDKVNSNAYYISGGTDTALTVGTWVNTTILKECQTHSYSSTITTPATCTTAGVKTYTCTKCSHSYTEEITATGHSYGTLVTAVEASCEAAGHDAYYQCSSCNKYFTSSKVETTLAALTIAATGHTWNSGEVTKEPTEAIEGIKTYTCTTCGQTKTEPIPTVAHEHTYGELHAKVNATCEEAGCQAYYQCSVCNKYFTSSKVETTLADLAISATGHSWNSGEVTKEATESETGTMTYTCTVCSETKDETIPMLEPAHTHVFDSKVTTAPSTTVAGSVTYSCTTCNATLKVEIPAVGTSRIYFTNNKGWSTIYAHTWAKSDSSNTTTWPGTKMTYSHKNGDNQSVYYVDVPTGHNMVIFNDGSNKTSDTAMSTTTNAYYLVGDASSYTLGTWVCYFYPTICSTHTFGASTVTKEATVTSTGIKTSTCTTCGAVLTEIIPMIAHTHEYNAEYTFDSKYHYHVCTICGNEADTGEHSLTLNGDVYVCDVCGYEKPYVAVNGIKLHYSIPSSELTTSHSHTRNRFHLWSDGSYSAKVTFTTYSDSYGYLVTIPQASIADCTYLGLIIKCSGSWENGEECWACKDGSVNKMIRFDDLTVDDDGYYNAYFVFGADDVYTSLAETQKSNIKSFNIYQGDDSNYYIGASYSVAPTTWSVTKNGVALCNSGNTSTGTLGKLDYSLGSTFPTMNDVYELTCNINGSTVKQTATMWDLYSTSAFESNYGYSGQLGAIYSSSSTTFKVWSPIATSMKLRVYESGTPSSLGGSDHYTDYTMTLGSKGVWSYTLNGDQSGTYYNYVVTNYAFKNAEAVDPYAKSTGINGLRGMVVNFDDVNPSGWDALTTLAYDVNSLAVYEAHIADLTSSSTWGGTAEYAKTFLGACETGTTYTSGGTTVSTGFDHIKELGVNAVQLLPIFDGSNDETNPSYNWGYNPLNYNALEGAYSTDPYDGYTKIREFKQLMMAYNQAGIEIIMDVVFNHVSDLDTSSFNILVPGYYYRYSGKYASNGSGCGSETCSERYMMRKFMIDSTEFWSTEYKIGGFRFDLMGVHDVTTMAELAANLKTKVSQNTVVYGEPWSCGCTTSATLAELNNLSQFNGYGNFNSSIRDSLMGNTDGTTQAWVAGVITETKDGNDINHYERVKSGILGYTYGWDNSATSFSVQYASCHDNYLIYDHFIALKWEDATAIKKAAMLTNSIVLTSNGVSFFAEGEEFLRTKKTADYDGSYSIHNTYNAPYEANALDYSLKITNRDMVENYKKLVALKVQGISVNASSMNPWTGGNTFDYTFTSGGKTYKVIHNNGVSSSLTCNDLSGYTVYLDTRGVYASGTTLGSSTTIYDFETLIVYK